MEEYHFKLKGIHRPFSKALKSLYWISKFVSKSKDNVTPSNFYITFFLYILHEISIRNTDDFSEEEKGYFITNETSVAILTLLNNLTFEEVKKKVRLVLSAGHKNSDEERMIYNEYKKCSYYITLAKSLGVLNKDYSLTKQGEQISKIHSSFFKLSKNEKNILGLSVFRAEPILISSIAVTKHWEIKYKDIGIPLYQLFLKELREDALFIYVKSHQSNYVDVINSWFRQIDLFDSKFRIRRKWKECLYLKLPSDVIHEIHNLLPKFEKEIVIPYLKLVRQNDAILASYHKALKDNKAIDGYVNLYDMKKCLKMSYERFNKSIEDFYLTSKDKYIVLVSNIVNSIDKRRRFIIDNRAALSIKIIKK